MELEVHCWTVLPGSDVMVRWDGSQEISVYQRCGIWDLSPLVVGRGVVLGWLALVNHPELGPWPMVPLTVCRRNLYRAAAAPVAELARQQGVRPIRSAEDLTQPGLFDFGAEPASSLPTAEEPDSDKSCNERTDVYTASRAATIRYERRRMDPLPNKEMTMNRNEHGTAVLTATPVAVHTVVAEWRQQ